MIETVLKTIELPWKKLEDFPGDVEGKILRQEPARGAKTVIIKLKPGMQIIPHNHIGVVQHLVLSGSYNAGAEHFAEGSYRLIPPHAEISPIFTESGATILMIYDPI